VKRAQHGESENHELLVLGRKSGLPGSTRLLLYDGESDIGDLDGGHFGESNFWFGAIYLENDRKKANQFYLREPRFPEPLLLMLGMVVSKGISKDPLRMVVLKDIVINRRKKVRFRGSRLAV